MPRTWRIPIPTVSRWPAWSTTAEVAIGRNDDGELRQKENQTLSEVFTSFEQGPMVRTDNKFDLALSGSGFFAIEGDDGTRYTRNGGLSLNAFSELVTLSGKRVLDDGGAPITMKGDEVRFSEDGGVFVDGKQDLQPGCGRFPQLQKAAIRRRRPVPQFRPGKQSAAGRPKPSAWESGFLEGSNADPISTMVGMIADFRSYEADQKVIKAMDETLGAGREPGGQGMILIPHIPQLSHIPIEAPAGGQRGAP